MKTTTLRRHRATLLALVLVGFGSLPALTSAGGPIVDPALPHVEVRVADLNLNSRAGVSTLYRRLVQASRAVCASLDGRTLRERAAFAACRRESLERAVRDVGHPGLLAMHGTRSRNPAAG